MARDTTFFKKAPSKGANIGQKGFAQGLADIARALELMEVYGGHIEWGGGYPTIVMDPALSDPMGIVSFYTRLEGANLTVLGGTIYKGEQSPVNVADSTMSVSAVDQYIYLKGKWDGTTGEVISSASLHGSDSTYFYRLLSVIIDGVLRVHHIGDYEVPWRMPD